MEGKEGGREGEGGDRREGRGGEGGGLIVNDLSADTTKLMHRHTVQPYPSKRN
jgi:hypothetical protein